MMSLQWCHESDHLYSGTELIGELLLDISSGVILHNSAVEQVKPGVFKISKTFLATEQTDFSGWSWISRPITG